MIYPVKNTRVRDFQHSPVKTDMSIWLGEEKGVIRKTGYINQALGVTEEQLAEESLNQISQSKERYLKRLHLQRIVTDEISSAPEVKIT